MKNRTSALQRLAARTPLWVPILTVVVAGWAAFIAAAAKVAA